MNLTDAQFFYAAAQIRSTEAMLESTISQLRDTRQWVGADAERFYAEWEADVRNRLRSAAMKLEGLALIPFI